jgi:polyphosphate:AMP phosphotransferase
VFEAAQVGHQLSKAAFERRVEPLRTRLLELQARLAKQTSPLIVIVAGVEMAGKSELVSRLNQWLDARTVQITAFWDESDEERERPRHWRYWRALPAAGNTGILLGAWYGDEIGARARRDLGRDHFEAELGRIAELERTLADDGALLVKLWLHISRKEQAQRLKAQCKRQHRKPSAYEKSFVRHYKRFVDAAEIALRHTDRGHAPWQVLDAADRRYTDFTAATRLADALEAWLDARRPRSRASRRMQVPRDKPTILDAVDLGQRVDKAHYEKQLDALQTRLGVLAWKARNKRRSTVAVFEGWDAAGKGGSIRRVVQALDARLVRVIPVSAPTDEEKAHHYLWRFWRQLPRAGYITLYDRSWYGRVLVERVEGLARKDEWMRAFGEINAFEEQLTEHGICLAKFWLHISPAEQLRRFRAREKVAHKRYKITADDWRNRQKWGAYQQAVDEMVARTSTAEAPWTLVAAEDKHVARLTVLRTLCEALERTLDS